MRTILTGLLVTGAVLLGSASADAAPYGQYYGFGDSLSDTGRVLRDTGYGAPAVVGPLFFNAPGIYEGGRWSNAPNYFEAVPGLTGCGPDRFRAMGDCARMAGPGSPAVVTRMPASPWMAGHPAGSGRDAAGSAARVSSAVPARGSGA